MLCLAVVVVYYAWRSANNGRVSTFVPTGSRIKRHLFIIANYCGEYVIALFIHSLPTDKTQNDFRNCLLARTISEYVIIRPYVVLRCTKLRRNLILLFGNNRRKVKLSKGFKISTTQRNIDPFVLQLY